MKFDVKTRPEHVTWTQMRDLWVAADDIEIFNAAWNWDHFYPLTGDLDGPNLEAWTTLAALADATQRIRIGVQVTGMIYRHPAVLANMAATVDIISNGRLELGHRRRLERAGDDGVRHRAAAAEAAVRPVRRGHADPHRPAARRVHRLRR